MIPTVKRILHATDLSEHSKHAFGFAAALASKFEAKITLFHVIEDFSPNASSMIADFIGEQGLKDIKNRRAGEFIDTMKSRMADFCGQMSAETPECDLLVDEIEAGSGHPAEEILRMADSGRFDLIVIGTPGIGGLAGALMGSTARRVVRRSEVPVLTVRLPGNR
jgi:nucleotide-binding universal stress UspA family protein